MTKNLKMLAGLITVIAIAVIIFYIFNNQDKNIIYGEEPAKWFACEVDADCIYFDSSVCDLQDINNYRAVNKNYTDQLYAVNAEARKTALCTLMIVNPPDAPITCQAGACTKAE